MSEKPLSEGKWPEKIKGLLLTSAKDYEARGWNACHDAFMKVINALPESMCGCNEFDGYCQKHRALPSKGIVLNDYQISNLKVTLQAIRKSRHLNSGDWLEEIIELLPHVEHTPNHPKEYLELAFQGMVEKECQHEWERRNDFCQYCKHCNVMRHELENRPKEGSSGDKILSNQEINDHLISKLSSAPLVPLDKEKILYEIRMCTATSGEFLGGMFAERMEKYATQPSRTVSVETIKKVLTTLHEVTGEVYLGDITKTSEAIHALLNERA